MDFKPFNSRYYKIKIISINNLNFNLRSKIKIKARIQKVKYYNFKLKNIIRIFNNI